jgi:hypothetical protein
LFIMPIIKDITLTLDMERLANRQGIGTPGNVKPGIMALTQELLDSVHKQHLLLPAIAYEIYKVTAISGDRLTLENGTALHGRLLATQVAQAKVLGVAVYTIGSRLEDRVYDHFQQGEPMKGLLLDGIGNAFLDSLSQQVCQVMSREAATRGHQSGSPLNPGVPGWPIADQPTLFCLVPAEEAGLSLTPLAMMMPRKSLSAVFGMGSNLPEWSQADACRRCNLNDSCSYRIRA